MGPEGCPAVFFSFSGREEEEEEEREEGAEEEEDEGGASLDSASTAARAEKRRDEWSVFVSGAEWAISLEGCGAFSLRSFRKVEKALISSGCSWRKAAKALRISVSAALKTAVAFFLPDAIEA